MTQQIITTPVPAEVVTKARAIEEKILSAYAKATVNKKGKLVVDALDTLDDIVFSLRIGGNVQDTKDEIYNRVVRFVEGVKA